MMKRQLSLLVLLLIFINVTPVLSQGPEVDPEDSQEDTDATSAVGTTDKEVSTQPQGGESKQGKPVEPGTKISQKTILSMGRVSDDDLREAIANMDESKLKALVSSIPPKMQNLRLIRFVNQEAATGDLPALKLLLDAGPESLINGKGYKGMTPLMTAARNGKYEIVEFLLSKGAKKDEQNKDGKTAYEIAREAKAGSRVANLLFGKGPKTIKVKPETETSSSMQREPDLDVALTSSINSGFVKAVNAYIARGNLQGLKALLDDEGSPIEDKEGVINGKDDEGMTPLTTAAKNGNYKIVEFLLKKGAKKDMQNEAGLTALDIAKEEKVDSDVIKLLSEWDGEDEENWGWRASTATSTWFLLMFVHFGMAMV